MNNAVETKALLISEFSHTQYVFLKGRVFSSTSWRLKNDIIIRKKSTALGSKR